MFVEEEHDERDGRKTDCRHLTHVEGPGHVGHVVEEEIGQGWVLLHVGHAVVGEHHRERRTPEHQQHVGETDEELCVLGPQFVAVHLRGVNVIVVVRGGRHRAVVTSRGATVRVERSRRRDHRPGLGAVPELLHRRLIRQLELTDLNHHPLDVAEDFDLEGRHPEVLLRERQQRLAVDPVLSTELVGVHSEAVPIEPRFNVVALPLIHARHRDVVLKKFLSLPLHL